ncbi:MAG: beta-lactamase family protein [Methanobacteriota archaeon]|nr:MAG: beta-lactamase family protein [Euryarchaeota archaeon]
MGICIPEALISSTAEPASLREWVAHCGSAGEFSGVVLVARGARPVFEQAVGLAYRASGVANTMDTRFNLGSINKTFTSVAIAQLVEAGRIDFDASIGTYLPDYPNPDAARTITIHHLMTHTAGLPPYMSPRYMSERDRIHTLDDLVRVFASRPLQFEPGSRQEYSNSGYVLLGRIVEEVGGTPYEAYVKTHIYDPAGMSRTGFEPLEATRTAKGYMVVGSDGHPVMSRGPTPAAVGPVNLKENTAMLDRGNPAGGGYSTAPDLVAFANALRDGTLLGPAMTDHLLNGTFSGVQRPKHGYALREQVVGGRRFVGNGGGAPGINAEFRFEPGGDYSVVVLSNLGPPSATAILEHVLGVPDSLGA